MKTTVKEALKLEYMSSDEPGGRTARRSSLFKKELGIQAAKALHSIALELSPKHQ